MSQKASKYLKKIYKDRQSKNSSYSIRAFARDCHISGGRMSEYFVGKRQLTFKTAKSICEKSNLSESEKENLIKFFQKENLFMIIKDPHFKDINTHLLCAIISSMDADDFTGSPHWISDKLGESVEQIEKNIETLINYGLVEKNGKNEITLKQKTIKAVDNICSQSSRESHKLRLQKVIETIDKVNMDDKHLTSMTMCISKSKINIAKQKIEIFLDEMSELLESDIQKEIYELNVQLYPWNTK